MLSADGNHLLGDERFLPVFEEADRLGVMLGIHASGSHLGGAGVDLFPRFIQAHTCSHAFGQLRQLTSVVFEGIPERFPRLRLAFLEAGCGWAPYWMERMDDEYAKRAEEAPALRKKPSEYIRSGSIYFSCEADEWLLPQAVKLVGENQIVYASDFPHWDHSFPGSIDEIRDRGDITDAQKRKILADNTRRLYGLKP
jgi:predicted TIM-barrel fold metal-dependent hydrolase